ncbi:adenosylcobinamide-phosphate synthase CbiB [Alphaproteobacteria bacterium LSUCC0684]
MSLTENLLALVLPHEIGTRCLVLAIALGLDAALGEPPWLWRHLPHPVVVFGRAISMMERRGNRRRFRARTRRRIGFSGIIGLVLLSLMAGLAIMSLSALGGTALTLMVEMLLIAILLAGRSLDEHVRAVAMALREGNLQAARRAVSMIVGRNPDSLDEHAIARAGIETTAENLSDGVIAPALFYLAGGLPGILAYKMINTADSMIGYKSARYLAFGWGAARMDDLANLVPARLTGCLLSMAVPSRLTQAVKVMWRDAGHHRSPNAGWPEAAMAAVLDVALAGPRRYGVKMTSDRPMHAEGRREATPQDVLDGLKVMWRAIALFILILLITGLALILPG